MKQITSKGQTRGQGGAELAVENRKSHRNSNVNEPIDLGWKECVAIITVIVRMNGS